MKKIGDNKKGLSTIVTTLLIILLILIAIGIMWIVIRKVIIQGSEQVSLGKFTLDLEIKSVVLGTDSVDVKVKRNPGTGEMSGLKFIVDDGDATRVVEKTYSMNELQERTFTLEPGDLQGVVVANIQKIEIAPMFTLGSGKSVAGPVKDEYVVSTGDETEPPPTECSSAGDCDDSNDCTTDTCPSGTCVNTAITSCTDGDGCCPSGCTSSNDDDCVDCTGDGDCDDSNACTTDTCSSGTCSNTAITSCTDGDGCCPSGCISGNDNDCTIECITNSDCSTGYICQSGTCVEEAECSVNSDCDDSDSCTTDTCSSGTCSNVVITSCTNGDGCCPSGCTFGNDDDCTAPDWYDSYLVSWWTFDTNAEDVVGSNEGTVVNGVSHVTSGCQSGGCYDFDGSNDYIDVGTFSVSGDEITISAWANYEGSSFALDPRIISKAHGTQSYEHIFTMGLDDTSTTNAEYRWRFTTSTGTTSYEAGSLSPNSGWYHVVMVYDGSDAIIYVDGISIGSEARTGNLITISDHVDIGRNPVGDVDGYRLWNGKLDEIMIWNRALGATEVQAVYNYFN